MKLNHRCFLEIDMGQNCQPGKLFFVNLAAQALLDPPKCNLKFSSPGRPVSGLFQNPFYISHVHSYIKSYFQPKLLPACTKGESCTTVDTKVFFLTWGIFLELVDFEPMSFTVENGRSRSKMGVHGCFTMFHGRFTLPLFSPEIIAYFDVLDL